MRMAGMILEVMSRPGPKAAMAAGGSLACGGWLGVLAGYYLSSEPTLPAQPVWAGASEQHARHFVDSDDVEVRVGRGSRASTTVIQHDARWGYGENRVMLPVAP